MNQWKSEQPSPWQKVMAARAMGEQPDPADVDEARRRAQPDDTPAWVRAVAGKISGGAPAEPEEKPQELSAMERRLRRRLGMPVGDPPDAA